MSFSPLVGNFQKDTMPGITNLFDFFARTFVINLAERKDRRKAIAGELERNGVRLGQGKAEIFAAVKPKERLGFPSVGARGCFLSHLHILERARESRLVNVLIIEDDLTISPAVRLYGQRIANDLKNREWGLVYLGHVQDSPYNGAPKLIVCDEPVLTAHFYAVNGPVIPRLVDYLEGVQHREPGDPLGGPMHLDGALTMFRQANPDVLTLIAHPNLGRQRPSRSNITCRWYDRWPVIREVVDFARALRDYGRVREWPE